MIRLRQSLKPIAAGLSVILFVTVLVFWSGAVSRPACLGRNRLVEATPSRLVIDDSTVQLGRGGLWVGRCRVTVEALLTFKDFRDYAEEFLGVTRRVDVFRIDGLSPPLSGVGRQAGAATEQVQLNVLRYELDGVLLPPWLLLLVTGAAPAWWVARRLLRGRRFPAVAGPGEQRPNKTLQQTAHAIGGSNSSTV